MILRANAGRASPSRAGAAAARHPERTQRVDGSAPRSSSSTEWRSGRDTL